VTGGGGGRQDPPIDRGDENESVPWILESRRGSEPLGSVDMLEADGSKSVGIFLVRSCSVLSNSKPNTRKVE
jgi:hypothetical protein